MPREPVEIRCIGGDTFYRIVTQQPAIDLPFGWEDRMASDAPAEPFMWGVEWEGGCGRMFREACQTEEEAFSDAGLLKGRAFPLFRHAASAPTVEEVARLLKDLAYDDADADAARIIELFQGKA
jgi:hypothetical protein